MATIREFYIDLYSERGRDSFEHVLRGILNGSTIPQLSDRQRQYLDKQLLEGEMYNIKQYL